MREKHVISFLENTPLASLSESDLTAIRAHTDNCENCRRAFEAAHLSMLMLKERATETFEPSHAFHTRVLARLRERQAANELWAWGRMWRAAGALASSMVATVAALAVLTFVIPGSQIASGPQEVSALTNSYSAEEVILNQTEPLDEQVSDDQVLTTIYGGEEEAVR
jgi:anti-sigma-K factor RskA